LYLPLAFAFVRHFSLHGYSAIAFKLHRGLGSSMVLFRAFKIVSTFTGIKELFSCIRMYIELGVMGRGWSQGVILCTSIAELGDVEALGSGS
jgi:hypothetical protein